MQNLLRSALRSPSSFPTDPRGWLRNQLGHAYIIGGLGVALGVYVWAVVAIYAVWEWVQWRRYDAEVWDCFEDLAHVTLGVLIVAGGYEIAVAHAMLLASGYLRRKT